MALNTTNQQTQSSENLPKAPPTRISIINQKGFIPLVIGVVILLIIVALGAYYLGTKKTTNSSSQQSINVPSVTQSLPTEQPSQSLLSNSLGVTTWSLAEAGNEAYLRQTINLSNNKVDYPNSKARTISNVYSQDDKSYEPQEVTSLDTSKYGWVDILKEPIKDSTGSVSILVSDRLFSFKKVLNTNNFLFVVELSRSASVSTNGPWSPYQNSRDLYLYDRSSGKGELKKITSFANSTTKYTYPKINSFNQDGRYVFIQLFGCWNCGGHVPETFLVDLQTFKFQNIGKTSYFSWKLDGNYEYKDYVVIECKEPQPGECSQDPSTLPLKVGKI
ncbi:hypothetical protein HYZ05_02185 [Candidatus Daviesbacteria bacterium]|nr:hypothetical protein [Candidatus Daviesbacteria bacterium]